MESNINFKYYAFISYSNEDEEFAKRIQKKYFEETSQKIKDL